MGRAVFAHPILQHRICSIKSGGIKRLPGASTFDVQNANRTLDKLTIQLSIVNVNPQNLEKASSILSRLQKMRKNA